MKLVDPDGEAIYAYDEKTQLAIMGYMKKLFGETNIFKFKTNGNLEINHKEFRKYYKTATDDQKKLLDGFNEAIRSSKVATVKIQDNDNYFSFQASNDKYIADYKFKTESGCTSIEYLLFFGYAICINDKGIDANLLSAGTDESGNNLMIVPPVSSTFVHETLDEFLNFLVKEKTTTKSKNIDKVDYQNTALRILGIKERDGSDHNY